jgi:hypothetical protein
MTWHFAPDGTVALIGDTVGTVAKVWNLPDGRWAWRIHRYEQAVGVAATRQAAMIDAARVWDERNGWLRTKVYGPKGATNDND